YNGKEFVYIGNCGTGFDEKTLSDLYQRFEPFFTDKSPFKKRLKIYNTVQWLRPKLVCQVKFGEWTKDGIMRHPVFLGLRKDEDATEVKREIPEEMKKESAKKDAYEKAIPEELSAKSPSDYELKV